ncbi:MAG: hypothetical protein RR653_14565, partial [Clostridia bacterium]
MKAIVSNGLKKSSYLNTFSAAEWYANRAAIAFGLVDFHARTKWLIVIFDPLNRALGALRQGFADAIVRSTLGFFDVSLHVFILR